MKPMYVKLRFLIFGVLVAGIMIFATTIDGVCAEKMHKMAPPGGNYKKVSSLVALPDFIPGLGTLYVDPATLPAGPFLAYDKKGHLVSTVYMIPIKDINDHKEFKNLKTTAGKVDHVDMYFNAGHPGVPEPHYHVILWYISPEKAAELK
ncbi:MAG TPA: DUF5602 domain-containing protein [Syntrophales bacterium]|nr:DUF5602 domain-containing protein [Syntrophales bacterium]